MTASLGGTQQGRKARSKGGFTLVELMLVVVIIGILAAIVIPRLVGKTQRARMAATKMSIESITVAFESFEMDLGHFPATEEGIAALVERPASAASGSEWHGPYLKQIPLDPWRQEFVYKYPGERAVDFDLISPGPDGEEGTEDDITNYRQTE